MKKCLYCQKEFEKIGKNQKYCSKECKKKDYKPKRYIKFCKLCGKEFDTTHKKAEWCSKDCSNKSRVKEKIIKTCLYCGKELVMTIKKGERKNYCSKDCLNKSKIGKELSKEHKEKISKFFKGRVLTEEHKRKIGEANRGKIVSQETREKLSNRDCYLCGERHYLFGKHLKDETRQKLSNVKKGKMKGEDNPFYGKKHSQEMREKMSFKMSQRILSGEYAICFSKGIFHSNKNNKDFIYRSSWEEVVMEQLEKDENVLSYDVEPFSIEYNFNDCIKHYIPDMLIEYKDGSKKLIEIKPSCFVEHELNLSKFDAAISFCQSKNIQFEVWTEENIKD